MKIILLPLWILLVASCGLCPAQDLLITEFMASNDDGLRDEDGESSDWIEVHNSGLEPVNLDGWYLTDSAANLRRWGFPPAIIAGGEFLVVFASGKALSIYAKTLENHHTFVKIKGSGVREKSKNR